MRNNRQSFRGLRTIKYRNSARDASAALAASLYSIHNSNIVRVEASDPLSLRPYMYAVMSGGTQIAADERVLA